MMTMKIMIKCPYCGSEDDWEIDPDVELEKLMIENADVLKRLKEC